MPDATLRQSPLHDVHVAAGAAFTEFAGWSMPVRYSGDLAEHHAVRRAAGLFDLSHMAEILVLGPGRGRRLDAALLGELSTTPVGRAKYSLLLNGEGGIEDDLVVYRTGEDRYLVVANAANREVVVDHLRDRVVGFDAQVQDETDDIGLIAIQGPRSQEILLEVPGFAADDEDPTEARFRELLASCATTASFARTGTVTPCSSRAPATRARTASSSTRHLRCCRGCGPSSWTPAAGRAWCPPASPVATPSGSRRACPCTATS